ncbi:MAG: 4a-hydroxytetrahydrobiopterin dehydratase [Acidobacteria bacterium]|nr:4a-hydroxytetrahydrobiopterin dehydratase [Acidobacteriota bacterium]
MERRKLSPDEIAERLKDLPNWVPDAETIKRRFKFKNFAESLAFVNKVGAIAEQLDHHPDITFGWGYAEIATTTHDRDGVTDVDLALAQQIDVAS